MQYAATVQYTIIKTSIERKAGDFFLKNITAICYWNSMLHAKPERVTWTDFSLKGTSQHHFLRHSMESC